MRQVSAVSGCGRSVVGEGPRGAASPRQSSVSGARAHATATARASVLHLLQECPDQAHRGLRAGSGPALDTWQSLLQN
eukprot:9473693-Pyramimonas_sp.AAC.1